MKYLIMLLFVGILMSGVVLYALVHTYGVAWCLIGLLANLLLAYGVLRMGRQA